MNLQDARKKLPELAGLSDESALNVIHQAYYPTMDKADLSKRLGIAAPEAPAPERSTMRAVGDLATQFGGGVVSGVRMMTDMFGADNRVSQGLRSAEEALQSLQSAAAQQDQQKVAAIMQEAEGKGWGEQIALGLKAAMVAPGAMMAQSLGTAVPTLATSLIPGVGPAAVAARMGAGAAVGAAQGAGNIKGVIYEDVKRELAKANPGMSAQEIEARAVEAQSFAGENAGQIALGGALGVAAGTTGMERALSGLRNGVTKAPAGVMTRALAGGTAEAVPEFAQGGQEKYASNVAQAGQGLNVDPWSGVVAQGTMEAAAGFAPGAISGIPAPKVATTPGQDVANTIRAENMVPESGPLGRAVNAGTEAKAQQAEAQIDASLQPNPPAVSMTDMLAPQADPVVNESLTAAAPAADQLPDATKMVPDQLAQDLNMVPPGVDPATGEVIQPAPQPDPLDFTGKTDAELQQARKSAQSPAIRNAIAKELQARRAAATPVDQPAADKPATLPTNLASAKERYNYGQKGFDLAFDNDIDRAAYITALTKPDGKRSAKDADYLKFAMDATGMTEADVRAHGQKVKDSIKAQAKGADPGKMTVPKLFGADVTLTNEGKTAAPITPETGKPAKAAPVQAPAVTRKNAIKTASDAAAKAIAGGASDADANRAATDALISQMSGNPDISIAVDAPAAVAMAKKNAPAPVKQPATSGVPEAGAGGSQPPQAAPAHSEAQEQWTRSTTNDRIAIARAGGIALKPAENVAKKAWGDLAPEAQEKLVRGIAKQTGRAAPQKTGDVKIDAKLAAESAARTGKAEKAMAKLDELFEKGSKAKTAEDALAAIDAMQEVNLFELDDNAKAKAGAKRIDAEEKLYALHDKLKAANVEATDTTDKPVDSAPKNDQVAEANDAPAITREQERALYEYLREVTDGDALRYATLAKKFQRTADGTASDDAKKITLEWLQAMTEDGSAKQKEIAEGKLQAEVRAAEAERIQAEKEASSLSELKAGRAQNPRYKAFLDTLEQSELDEVTNSSELNTRFMAFTGQRKAEFEKSGGDAASSEEFTKFVREYADKNLASRLRKAEKPKAQDAAADGKADDWMGELFGGESQAAEPVTAKKTTPDRDKSRLASVLATAKSEAEASLADWQGRSYKDNSKQVNFEGDGPTRNESMSISAINEGRKRKAIEALTQEVKAIEKLEQMLGDEKSSDRLLDMLDSTMEQAEKDIANGTAIIGKTPAEAFEYAVLQSLDIKPAQGAYSSNKVSKALFGYLNGAANSADTNAAAPPDDVVEIKDKFGRKHSVRQSDLDGKEDRIPTVRSNGEVVAGEEIPRSIIEVESSAADQPTETPKLTEAQAKGLMSWESLGTKGGVTKHILTFYESQADKDANRGRMTVATVTKGDRSATAWMVDGDDQTFGPLSLAKKRGMEVGMAKAVADGFVQTGRETVDTSKDKKVGVDSRGRDVFEGTDGSLKGVRYTFDERGKVNTGALVEESPEAPAKAKKKPQTAKQKREALENHFRPGNVIQSDYWKEFDRVVEFDWNSGNWSVTVEKVVKDGDGWKATEGKRNHSTTPDSRDKVVFEAPAPAEPVAPSPDAKPASKTPTYDAHNELIQQVVAGNATAKQFKASFESVLSNADAIKAELTTKTKAELLREGGAWVQMRYSNENKADIVDAMYRSMVGDYALNQSIQYSMGKGAYEAAVRRFVEATDDQRLADFAKERAAAIEEIKAKRAAKAAALENPQTLDDYRGLMTTKMRAGMTRKEAYLDLTAEQRVTFDELEAESTREARETRKRTQKTQVQAAGQTTGGEIVATKHTREGYDLFVVKLAERVSREDYGTLLSSAKKLGGWYSSFRGSGAIPGFQFKDKANAEAFLKLAAGDTTEAQAQVEQRRDAFEDDRSQTAAERLMTMADKLEESADESLNADRKTNTARRARFANAAEAAARAEKAMAKTMRNIAQAITDGKAKFLDAVRTKTQVQMLADIVRTAKDSELRAKYPAYADMEKRRGEPPTVETADFAEFPTFTAFRSDLASLGRQLLEVDGTKKLGQQLMNVADDVSDAYLEFAKEPANLVRLSTFSMRRGETVSSAAFASRDLAEKAIRRSNLTGKAIVLPLKRGDNRIIMSPSEAINAGVWKGDGDKRITLTKEAGQLLVQAIGRRANKQNRLSVPWQFESADTKLKALARMGIETPAEFRSAVREFIGLREQAQEADRVKMLERAMVGRKADGLDFFPTPQEAADAMVEAAEITPDMAVLEPSAGMGHLADRIRAAGAEPDVIEISAERRELLQEKGYNTQDVDDFMDLKPRQFYTFGDVFRAPDGKEGVMRGLGGMGSDRVRLQDEAGNKIGYYNRSELTGIRHRGTDSGYDRIIMNPPFSDRRDAAHVMHAYDLLKPGGRIVAIMGEGVFFGQDKKAEEFRAWFEERGGTSEKLAEGTFMDPSLPVTTGVNARMVVIDKPASAPMFSRSPATQQAYEARIDGLFSGEKAKTGTKILDSSDVMGLLGYPKLPLVLNERHLIDGLTTHPEVTAEAWKRVPEWIENPVAVYKSLDGKNPQRVVLLAPELLAGKPVVMVIEPSPGVVGARTEKPSQEQLLVTVFAKTTGYVPLGNAAMQGKLLYLQKEMAPAISGSEGVQFPKHGHLSAGREKILTEKNLAGYRKKQDPAMSLGTGRGIEVETAQGVVDGIASRWTNAPEIVVVADLQDAKVPERVRLYDAEQRSQGASGEPEGFWYGGKAYIVAAAINTPQDVARVLFHETLGHYGLRGTFGEGLTPILKQLAAMRRPLVAAKAEQYGLDMGKESDRLQAAEEVLAEMAQSKPEMGYVKRAIAAIRAFLRKNVPGFQKMALTDADIIAQYILPARAFVERGPGGGGPKGGLSFSRSTDLTKSEAFKRWFGDSKVVDEAGKPLVVYHGTIKSFDAFDSNAEPFSYESDRGKQFFLDNPQGASDYATGTSDAYGGNANVMPVYLRMENPRIEEVDGPPSEWWDNNADALYWKLDVEGGSHDGLIVRGDSETMYVTANPAQIKSATGNNGDFDSTNPDIRFSRAMGATELAGQVRDKLNETFNHPGKLNWWHKTVGSQYNLAERNPAFKKVFDAAQDFINDVSYYATEAANLAPKILPKLETLKDLTKTAISAADNKAVAAPVFEGTLSWARDADGKPIRIEALEKRYENLTDDQKAQMLLRKNVVSEDQLKAWKASKLDVYQGAIRNRFESTFLKAGVRWTDAELKSIFKLTDEQVGLYKEFRAATDTSLDNMAKAQMLREAGKDVADMRDAVMEAPDVDTAAMMLREVLLDMANDNPDRADILKDAAAGVLDTAAKINELKKQGYAPLSRFGRFTVDVVVDGQREYFGLFESEGEANRMAAKMRAEFGAENVAQGTMSQKEFELFQGITPESLELFGNMMGLDSTGNEAQDKAFQTYLKLTKNNRSAMKRLIHRQGIAGYSEDVGRVLAAFVYANARQTSAALHIGQMDEAITAIPKGEGELKDHALELAKYIKEPREEAAAVRGLLFAQYLGGSVASAMVNFTQPLTVSIPYLSQFGGLAKAGKAWAQAVRDMNKGAKLEPGLERALKDAEESGVVSPQEVHQLMAQARGASTLQSGDGTKLGDAKAKVANGWTRTALAWGKLFGYAEQVNRRSTFIAAYRMAVDQKIPNPGAFAEKAVNETQFVNNKANKMKFGRGAIGATLMTFKSYSIHWLELMHRLSTQDGKDGKLAAAYMLGALFLVAGAGGLPFAGDAEDLIDAIAQKMGYNFSTKKAKQEFLESVFGKAGAQFVDRGLTGIPGVPIDVSGRMGMSNLIPGTGLLLEKRDSSRDLMELAGPAGDMAKRFFEAVGLLAKGEVGKAVETAAPKAVGNMIKGADMLDKGMYRDTKGAKVIDTTTGEAVAKMIGFQPASVSQVQESNFINQRAKDFYSLKTQEIRAKWAMGIFENDPDKVAEARKMMEEWNSDNPDQRMTANMPAIVKKVREMRKDKAQRIADTAPKAMRAQMREDAKELANR